MFSIKQFDTNILQSRVMKLVFKMKSFICILLLCSVLTGLYASVDGDEADKKTSSNRNKNAKLVRVRRFAETKKHKDGCDRSLSIKATSVGAAAGAGIGAATGAAVGSVVPIIGTGIGALLGKCVTNSCQKSLLKHLK